MRVLTTILLFLFMISGSNASEIVFDFDSPSFSGQGKSSHYLTIEAAEKAAKEKAEQDAKNTAIAKFKANLESRFYTALAKQITTNVFGADGLQQDSGTFTSPIGGEVVTWETPAQTGNVTITVTETDGTVTTFTMPKED
jgi:hypothetical protein